MADLRHPSIRLVLIFCVVVLGLFELRNLLETLASQSRLRDRVVRGLQEPLQRDRARLDALLAPGGLNSWNAALKALLPAVPADEVELFTTAGRRLTAFPGPAPVDHWLTAADQANLRLTSIIAVGPVAGGGGRLL